jgi:isoamylase
MACSLHKGAFMPRRFASRSALLTLYTFVLATSCTLGDTADDDGNSLGKADGASDGLPTLGARRAADGSITFQLYSSRATRIELDLFDVAVGANERMAVTMTHGAGDVWSVTVDAATLAANGLTGTIYYGYRAWGPNWPFDAGWTRGSGVGFVADCDGAGNRFNPNKLLFDPYARELSHDPVGPTVRDGTIYGSGPQNRNRDSGQSAPKGVVLDRDDTPVGDRPARPLRDEVIYEVHLKGLSKQDPSIGSDRQGTYAGAGDEAAYLASIGVTAVEFLPIQESDNDGTDLAVNTTNGANYWGYATLDFFAPDRRYALDKSAGGPTREFKQMVRAFHDHGIKVYLDVVYNHTGEGYLWSNDTHTANVLSYRGIDNAAYYELTGDHQFYFDVTGTGGNFNVATKAGRDLVIDSLRYWRAGMGVDGFRFDLAAALGNRCSEGCYQFDKLDPNNVLNRAAKEVPARPDDGGFGADLIAEPWAAGGDNNFQVGGFPWGWAEWNGIYRDTIRKAQNKLGLEPVTPGELATRVAGSSDLYGDDGRKPFHSINFIVAHDGFTLRDLYAYNTKNNNQAFPFGPSDGGSDNNISWDQGGDRAAQRQAARTGMALLMTSAGTPMILGGDEMYRTQYGNNNAYNLDSNKNWLDYSNQSTFADFATFSRRLITFRNAHASLRRASFYTGGDPDGNGLKDITWYRDNGNEADGGYMTNASNHFLAWRVDAQAAGESIRSIYVAYNGWQGVVTATLPAPAAGKAWYRAGDTAAWNEGNGNFSEPGTEARMDATTYDLQARSVLILVER